MKRILAKLKSRDLIEADAAKTAVKARNMQHVARLIRENNTRISASTRYNQDMLTSGGWPDGDKGVAEALKVGRKAMADILESYKGWERAWSGIDSVEVLGEGTLDLTEDVLSEKKMTREDAYRALKAGKPLSTAMLEPLGISFEAFLKFAQLGDKKISNVIEKYLKQLEDKYGYE